MVERAVAATQDNYERRDLRVAPVVDGYPSYVSQDSISSVYAASPKSLMLLVVRRTPIAQIASHWLPSAAGVSAVTHTI